MFEQRSQLSKKSASSEDTPCLAPKSKTMEDVELGNYRSSSAVDSGDQLLRVMTFNTWLMPFVAECCFVDSGVSERAVRVAKFLRKHATDCDLLLLQEVWASGGTTKISAIVNALCCCKLFGRTIVENMALSEYYTTRPTSMPCCSMQSFGTFMDSGLVIASRWPIDKERFVRFANYAQEDGMAAKGVLMAYTNGIIVVNTHMNAGHRHGKCRMKQLAELRVAYVEFRDDLLFDRLPVSRTVIAGDWNIDANSMLESGAEEYRELSREMESHGLKDAFTRPILRSVGEPTTESCRAVGASNLDTATATAQRLDVIFTNATVESIEARWKDTIKPQLYDSVDPEMVSDHAPVIADLRFTH